MPPILRKTCKRIPRGRSYTREAMAGCVLIALHWPLSGPGNTVFLRNVFCNKAGQEIYVENTREFVTLHDCLFDKSDADDRCIMPVMADNPNRQRTFVSLNELLKRGLKVKAGPFSLEEAFPNCTVELTTDEWERLWAMEPPEPAIGKIRSTMAQEQDWGLLKGISCVDSDETLRARMFRLHHDETGVLKAWTPERVKRLCELWGLSLRELCRYICTEPPTIEAFVAGRLKSMPGAVCLWLHMMERMLFERDGADMGPLLPTYLKSNSKTKQKGGVGA